MTGKQRHIAHFFQIHSHRIVGALRAVGPCIQIEVGVFFLAASANIEHGLFAGSQTGRGFGSFTDIFGQVQLSGVVDQLDALVGHSHKQVVQLFRRSQIIGKGLVDLVVGQITFFFTNFENVMKFFGQIIFQAITSSRPLP